MSHASQGRNHPGDSDRRDVPNTEPLSGGDDTQAGHSKDTTEMATAFEPLNRSLETFLTRLSKTNERSEKKTEESLRNQDATRTNLMAALTPG